MDDMTRASELIPDLLRELESWVNIDSGTDDKQGVDQVVALAEARCRRSGLATTIHPVSGYGDHLVASRQGEGSARILLIGHLDTVYPKGTVAERPFTIRDGRAYGPGIFDMKAGILIALAALDLIGSVEQDRFEQITLLCNSDEEIGSPASTPLVRELAESADAVLVFEPVRQPNTITVARKGIAAYTLNVTGLSAHAGVTPDSGRNAILELAHLVVALQRLHNSIPTVSVNVGGISGGGRRNVVPDAAEAIFEMRAANRMAFDEAKAAIAQIIAAPRIVAGTTATLHEGPEHLPLEVTTASQRLIDLARDAGSSVGLAIHPISTGGASDGNTTGGMGIPTIDGLGAIGQHSHNPQEHIIIDELPRRIAFIANLLRRLTTWT